jgi:hypothetical protein
MGDGTSPLDSGSEMGANATDVPGAQRALALAGAFLMLTTIAACSSSPDDQQTLPAPRTASAGPEASAPPTAAAQPQLATPALPGEDDPVVQAVRRYFDAAYRAIEDDDLGSQSLRDASTPARAEQNAQAFADVVELSAPGPLPFTPTAIEETGPGQRIVSVCAYYWGWLRNPGSDAPTTALEVRAARVQVEDVDGTWKVAGVEVTEGDCTGVEIREELW